MADDYWCPDCDVSNSGPGTCVCGKPFVDISSFDLDDPEPSKISDDADPLLSEDLASNREELPETA